MDDEYEQPLFIDIEEGGFELDEDGPDRGVFHHIWTLLVTGDLVAGDGWRLLSERYPDEPSFRGLAAARLAEQHGAAPPVVSLEQLLDSLPAEMRHVADAVLVVIASCERSPQARAELERLARSRAIAMDVDRAHEVLYDYEWSVLRLGERRTRGDAPWKARPQPSPLDYATALERHPGEPMPYSPHSSFEVGDRIRHSRFGLGVVTQRSPSRMTVLFPSGERTLVCG